MYSVILIDDEMMIREGLKLIVDWEQHGFRVIGEAKDGLSGAKLIKKENPDLILVDIRMPGLTGLELLEDVRNHGYQGEVIILTGYSEFEYAREALRLDVSSYLLKPIDEDELCSQLEVIKTKLDAVELAKLKKDDMAIGIRNSVCRKVIFEDAISEQEEKNLEDDAFLTARDRYHVVLIKRQKRYDDTIGDILKKIQATPIKIALDHYIILVFKNKSFRQLVVVLNNLSKQYYKITKEPCFITIGGQVVAYRNLNKSFAQANGLLERQFLYRNQNIIFYDAFIEEKTMDPNPIMDVNYLYGLVEVGNQEAVEVYFNQLEDALVLSNLSVEKIRGICVNGFVAVKDRLIQEYGQVEKLLPGSKEIIDKIYAFSNLTEILEYIRETLVVVADTICDGSYENTMKRLLNYIHKNYDKNLKLEALARLFNYNSSYLGKIFKEKVGQNFNSYLEILRIEHAKELLKAESLKIYQVAEKVGYNNVDYFFSKFKKHVGVSPKAYRNKYR